MIDSWSHSKLVEFEKCKRRTWLLHVKRVPEPPRDLRPGQTEQANDRGSRVHDEAERFVRGQLKQLPAELRSFEQEFLRLRALFSQGVVSLEGLWGYDMDWTPMAWKGEWRETDSINEGAGLNIVKALPDYGKRGQFVYFEDRAYEWVPCWHRSKLDAIVFDGDYAATVIDYKTGKKFGNEVKHGEQVQLYTLDTLMRYPKIEEVTTELWYVDAGEITTQTFSRNQGLKFQRHFTRRGMDITTCTEWPANPTIFTCRYCDYGSIGECDVSAKDKFTGARR